MVQFVIEPHSGCRSGGAAPTSSALQVPTIGDSLDDRFGSIGPKHGAR